jgi:hypothetical protein
MASMGRVAVTTCASLPTYKDFQRKTGQRGSTDYFLFFLGPGLPAHKKKRPI